MKLKGFLTQYGIVVFLVTLFTYTSCNLEPNKSQCLDELQNLIAEWCPKVDVVNMHRQGAFYEEGEDRFRLYRCQLLYTNQQSCQIPQIITRDTTSNHLMLLPSESVDTLSALLTYQVVESEWILIKVVLKYELLVDTQ